MPTFRLERLASTLCLIAACFVTVPALAQTPQPLGPSVLANTLDAVVHTGGRVAWRCDADVTMVVWWSGETNGNDNSHSSIQGRFFSGRTPTGPQFQVNHTISGIQNFPKVRVLDSGDFVVVWKTGNLLQGRVYDRITLAPGPEINFPMLTGDLENYDITADGRVAAVYQQDQLLQGQIFNGAGEPLGNVFETELVETNSDGDTRISILVGSESVVIYWMVEEQDEIRSKRRLAFQRFDLDGSPMGPEVTVAVEIYFNPQAFGTTIESVQAEMASNGDLLFGYQTMEKLGVDRTYRLFLERFDTAGQQNLSIFYGESMDQIDIDELLVEPNGDFLVAWSQTPDLFAQRFEADKPQGGPIFQLSDQYFNSSLSRMQLTRNAPGNAFAVVWDALNTDVHWRRFKSFPDILQDGFESGDTSRWCVARNEQ